jgi:1-acyl-sn-glycerol-3-phosphate acyltransferase
VRQTGLVGRPTSSANVPYRAVRALCRLATHLFRVRVEGLEHLPRDERGRVTGGWIAAGLPHRTWAEPLILVGMLPVEPRLAMMADAPTAVGSWWRRLLVGMVGGVVLIPRRAARGAAGFEEHVGAIERVLGAGAVFSIFPEVGRASRPPELRRVSPAVAYFAVRTGAPILPIVFGGTHDLFLRRPVRVRMLAPIAPPSPAPPAGSAAERTAADALLAELLDRARPVAADVHDAAQPPRGGRSRWRWLQAGFPRVE